MSQTTTDEDQERLAQLIKELEKKGVHPTRLAVFVVGQDQILAEVAEDDDFESISEHLKEYGFLNIDDPKRILRIQQVQGGGVTLSYLIGDFDLIEKGEINISPTCWYRIASQSPKSALSLLLLYRDYLDRKVKAKAEDAGIVLPTVESPFRKR